ncbi:hypothetical protein [Phocaeicola sp.]
MDIKQSLKLFLNYLDSDEEIEYYLRINADLNEEIVLTAISLARKVIDDYKDELVFPKVIASFCLKSNERVISILSSSLFNKDNQNQFDKYISQLNELKTYFLNSL